VPVARPLGQTLSLTVVPYEAAERLQDEYAPMARYLARELGCTDGRFVPVVDYAGVIAALETGGVDVAYLSPFPYALATKRMKLRPAALAMPWVEGSLTYRGIIFTRADSGVRSFADLRGRTFAFGDVTSTTGYLLPRAMLQKQGVFETLRWRNAGNANMVVKAVENRAADAGAAYESVFRVAYRTTPEKAGLMHVVARTEPIPNGIYVARGDLPGGTVDRLKAAFLKMNTDPLGREAMLKAPNDRIVAPQDRLFDPVRETASVLGLDLSALEKGSARSPESKEESRKGRRAGTRG
jgi:phosphonate transport system substrate-binding protein